MSFHAPMKPLLLIYSDDLDLYFLLEHVLQAEGFVLCRAGGLDEALRLASARTPDAILLDSRNSEEAARERCMALKRELGVMETPIVALLKPGAATEYVDLIKCDIDDAFVSPVWPVKLIACIRTMICASAPDGVGGNAEATAVRYADVEMDLVTHKVHRAGRCIHLSPIEFRLLHHFLQHPEKVISREELHRAAWQHNVHVGPRTIDVHVGRLRKALLGSSSHDLIRTVRSVGYALST